MAYSQGQLGFIYAMPFILLNVVGLAVGQIRYAIQEEKEHGAFVGNIANDLGLDLRKLAARGVRVTSSSSKQYLDINLGNGVLFVNERIDRETLCEASASCFLNMEVVIENPIEVHSIEVEILDVNDNAPEFPRKDYYLEISESAVPGARFPVESAQDPDVGTNSIRTYRLSQNNYFTLDTKAVSENSKFIELVLKKALDRETTSLHELVLTAIDGGTPPKSGTAQVTVRVRDINDNAPVFDKSTYKVSLLESAPLGSLVIKLNATDLDEGSNSDVLYSFSSYTPERVRQLFSVDSTTGEVRVNGTLNYEEATFYEIYMQATDKGAVSMAGHCKVLVELIDVNDNAPELTLTSLYSPVPENAQPETVVALLSATDQDSGQNQQLTLTIPSNLPFKLKPFKNSYTLVTDGYLDRESVQEYNITVTARDAGIPPLSTSKTIFLEVSDINDNPPLFEQSSYSVYVNENNAPGISLYTIKALDSDANENAYISYSLLKRQIEGLPVSSYVSVNSDTGDIYAAQSFDYEKLREFQFEIQALDAGNPPLSSTATVNVYVMDKNDNAPVILYPSSANGSIALEMIPRSADAGFLVTKVIAIDADSGQNAWLFYELLTATDPNLFKMDLHTGEIRTTRKLGEENTTSYSLTVLIRDNGEPSLSATASVSVVVVERVAKIIPNSRRHYKQPKNYSDLTLYLIIALTSISFIFLLTVVVIAAIKCHRYSTYGEPCCIDSCCYRERYSAEMYKQANNNVSSVMHRDLKGQPRFIEVRGNGSISKTYCYKACLTSGSGSDTFMFYDTAGQLRTASSVVVAERYLTGQSGSGGQNNVILCSPASNEQPKQPNTDWRYSASLRAGMQSSVILEESGVLRGGPTGPTQQWPTTSSATTDPEGGDVSPPVGAGVNSNSWTFKYGPANPQQQQHQHQHQHPQQHPQQPLQQHPQQVVHQPPPSQPPMAAAAVATAAVEFPENFIIPGSPAIISIRQDNPTNSEDKSDFITFGKKEDTKKKKKKRKEKGTKSLDKKEKGNSSADNDH